MKLVSFWRSIGLAMALLLFAGPAAPASAEQPRSLARRIDSLRPGEYIWLPERSAEGRLEIVINLGRQLAYVYRGGRLIGASTISSGRSGYDSPIGRFQILQKRPFHRSNRYSAAPMPFMQRLNWYGVALHGGDIPGYPASHGCIRLPMGFAESLYAVTELGSFVFVAEEPWPTPRAALRHARLNAMQPLSADRSPLATPAGSAR